MDAKILIIDIETAPVTVSAWGLRDQNIAINQIIKPDRLLCAAAQFVGERRVHFVSEWDHKQKGMARALHALLDAADVVCGWNSNRFDLIWINRLFKENGFSPPSPYIKLDLMTKVKRQFRLPSYKLDYAAMWLGIGRKIKTGGMDLWNGVIKGDHKAQTIMRKYNINDVKLTTEVFHALKNNGWLPGLPNQAIGKGLVCASCGSDRLHGHGVRATSTCIYQRYRCADCGASSRSVRAEPVRAQVVGIAP